MSSPLENMPSDQELYKLLVAEGILPEFAEPDLWHSLVRQGANDVWRTVSADGDKIVIKRPTTRHAGVGPQKEIHNTIIAANHGLAPQVLYFCEDTGINVCRYITGQTLSHKALQDHDTVSTVISCIRKLHGITEPFLFTHNYFAHVRGRIRKADKMAHMTFLEVLNQTTQTLGIKHRDSTLLKILRIMELLANSYPDFTPCHSDLVSHNVALTGQGHILFMDWEVSGMGDPHEDLATFLWSASLDKKALFGAMDQYFGGKNTLGHKRVLLYLALIPFDWVIRYQIRILEKQQNGIEDQEAMHRQRQRYKVAMQYLDMPEFVELLMHYVRWRNHDGGVLFLLAHRSGAF